MRVYQGITAGTILRRNKASSEFILKRIHSMSMSNLGSRLMSPMRATKSYFFYFRLSAHVLCVMWRNGGSNDRPRSTIQFSSSRLQSTLGGSGHVVVVDVASSSHKSTSTGSATSGEDCNCRSNCASCSTLRISLTCNILRTMTKRLPPAYLY